MFKKCTTEQTKIFGNTRFKYEKQLSQDGKYVMSFMILYFFNNIV